MLSAETVLRILREHKPYLEEHFGVVRMAFLDNQNDINIFIELEKKRFKVRFFLQEHLAVILHENVEILYLDAVESLVEKDLIFV